MLFKITSTPLPFTLYLLSFTACVPVPPSMMPAGAPGSTATSGPQSYPGLDAGATSITSLHFTIQAYNEADARNFSVIAESCFSKIGNDTGLYTYMAGQNYGIVLYKDQNEYMQKTKLGNWSHATVAGNSIYTYPDSEVEPHLIFEMAHLVLNGYLGTDKVIQYRWLEEGVAMYEELAKMPQTDRDAFMASMQKHFASQKMPFNQMTFYAPVTEEKHRDDAWYQQVESVVSFLLSQGGSLQFGNFLNELKLNSDLDHAIADTYPGKFRNLLDLENAWKQTT